MHLYITIPSIGGSAGNHIINGYLTNGSTDTEIFRVEGTGVSIIGIDSKYGFSGNASELPSAIAQQYEIVYPKNLFVSNDYYIKIVYTNNTDTDQTGSRVIYVWCKEFAEGA